MRYNKTTGELDTADGIAGAPDDLTLVGGHAAYEPDFSDVPDLSKVGLILIYEVGGNAPIRFTLDGTDPTNRGGYIPAGGWTSLPVDLSKNTLKLKSGSGSDAIAAFALLGGASWD